MGLNLEHMAFEALMYIATSEANRQLACALANR
jgi:hypothetical protein